MISAKVYLQHLDEVQGNSLQHLITKCFKLTHFTFDHSKKEMQFITKADSSLFTNFKSDVLAKHNLEINFIFMPLIMMELSREYLEQLKNLSLDINHFIKQYNMIESDERPNCFYVLKQQFDSLSEALEKAVDVLNIKDRNANSFIDNAAQINYDIRNNGHHDRDASPSRNLTNESTLNRSVDKFKDVNLNSNIQQQNMYNNSTLDKFIIESYIRDYVRKFDPQLFLEINEHAATSSTGFALDLKDKTSYKIFKIFINKNYHLIKSEKISYINSSKIDVEICEKFRILIIKQIDCLNIIGLPDDLIKFKEFIDKSDVPKDVVDDSVSSFEFKLSKLSIKVQVDNILLQKVDAIVSPSGPLLEPKIGLGAIVFKNAGPQVVSRCVNFIKSNKYLKDNQVFVTDAGNLQSPIKYIFHLASPRYQNKDDESKKNLRESFLNCFKEANTRKDVNSLALPFISTGFNQMPVSLLAESFIESVIEFDLAKSKHHFLSNLNIINDDPRMTSKFITAAKHSLKELQSSIKMSTPYNTEKHALFDRDFLNDKNNFSSHNNNKSNNPIDQRLVFNNGSGSNFEDNKSDTNKPVKIGDTTKINYSLAEHKLSSTYQPQIKGNYGATLNSPRNSTLCCHCYKYIIKTTKRKDCPHACCSSECANKICLTCSPGSKILLKQKSLDVVYNSNNKYNISSNKTYSLTSDLQIVTEKRDNSKLGRFSRSSSLPRKSRSNLLPTDTVSPSKSQDDSQLKTNSNCVICIDIIKDKSCCLAGILSAPTASTSI